MTLHSPFATAGIGRFPVTGKWPFHASSGASTFRNSPASCQKLPVQLTQNCPGLTVGCDDPYLVDASSVARTSLATRRVLPTATLHVVAKTFVRARGETAIHRDFCSRRRDLLDPLSDLRGNVGRNDQAERLCGPD